MLDKLEFLKEYNISEEDFNKTSLIWEDLMTIYNDFIKVRDELEPAANLISECLRKVVNIHSVKQRVKDPEHLVEKIIRKKIEKPETNITIENYTKEITDLIGIRALHLFKDEWEGIHDYITEMWDLAEKPKANIRKGDADSITDSFKDRGCEIKFHKFGYRSVHYLIEVKPYKKTYIAEIQVRTIFEEGWSEIDHKIRYPYDINNPILAQYLVVFNRLAGSADEMGSFVKFLSDELKNINESHINEIEEKDKAIREMQEIIDELTIEKEKRDELQKKIDTIKKKITLTDLVVNPSQVLLDPKLIQAAISLNKYGLKYNEKYSNLIKPTTISLNPTKIQRIKSNASIKPSKDIEK